MKCHRCGQDTSVLETRKADDGYTLRRIRSCPSGHRFPTYECAAPVYLKDSGHVAKVIATIKTRVELWQRDVHIATMAKRMSITNVSMRVGVSRASVSRIVKEMKKWLPFKDS